MHDLSTEVPAAESVSEPEGDPRRSDQVVSTHVLVPEAQVGKLRLLSRKTRIAQSEYLREAVDDLLDKYGYRPSEETP
jgi:ribbon-helix-helix protein